VDKATFAGLLIAFGGIIAGLVLEGGSVGQILQPTAAMIVFGGTIGAVMVQFPLPVVLKSFRALAGVFLESEGGLQAVIGEIVGYANQARKKGIISLDSELPNIKDPFLKKFLMLAIDGSEPQELRNMMELEMENQEVHEERIPQVFESAGGFSPTIGIIGAVLGLIQVMQHLDNITEVGRGIAVAFVATIYGVGAANILFLPCAGKLKIRMHAAQLKRAMMLEGVIAILEGLNPRMVETKLQGFLADAAGSGTTAKDKRAPGTAPREQET
jgi:chemotaxis protein MotA